MTFDLPVINEENVRLPLKEAMPVGWTLLVFLRHEECIECQMVVHQLNALRSALKQWSVSVLLVANGPVESIARLRERLKIDPTIPIVTDPSIAIQSETGLTNSMFASMGPMAMWNGLKAISQGFIQTRLFIRNAGLQSGAFLFDDNRREVWAHRSKRLGNIPDKAVILEAVLRHRALAEESP